MNTYQVTASHWNGKTWAVEVDGLPRKHNVNTQARRISEVEEMARDAIALVLDVEPDSFALEITIELPEPLAALQQALADAESKAEESRIEAVVARRAVARQARGLGFTLQEAGQLLGVSHQRVSQLINS